MLSAGNLLHGLLPNLVSFVTCSILVSFWSRGVIGQASVHVSMVPFCSLAGYHCIDYLIYDNLAARNFDAKVRIMTWLFCTCEWLKQSYLFIAVSTALCMPTRTHARTHARMHARINRWTHKMHQSTKTRKTNWFTTSQALHVLRTHGSMLDIEHEWSID